MFYSVDENGDEFEWNFKPERWGDDGEWMMKQFGHYAELTAGTIEKIIGKKLTWEDEAVEFIINDEVVVEDSNFI